MIERCEVRQRRNAKAGPVIGQDKSAKATGERLDIERVTSRSERSRWKSTQLGNSLAAYSTARPVRREGDAPSYLLRRRWVRSLPYTVRYTATNPARFEKLWR
jgi:hypothetical protein